MSKLRSYISVACLLLSLLGFNNLQAQLLYNNGAQLYTAGAAVLWVGGTAQNANTGNFTNEGQTTITADYINDATTQGDGEYLVAGDWVNNNTFLEGISQVRLNGANQLITGSQITTFYILDLLGTGIKTQTIDANINNAGTLFLNDRELATDVNTMFVLNPALNSVQRTTGFVSSLTTGRLSRVTNQNGVYLFPTGSSVGTLRYRPLEVTPLAATANTYAARLANYDANTDGYDRTITDTEVCEVNPLFFHVLNRTAGTENADVTFYYDQAADGLWTSSAQWNVVPGQWEDMAPVTAGVTTMDFISRAGWDDWTDEPYALTTTTPNLIVTDPTPVCVPNTVDITLAGVTAGSDAGTLTYYLDSLDAVSETNGMTLADAQAIADSGRYYISLNNGICNTVAGVHVVINALDDDGFVYANDTFCLGVGTEIPTVNTPGGAFTFAPAGLTINATTGEIDLTTSVAGSYDITYTTAGICPNDSTLTIVLQDPSDATFSYDALSYCEGALVNPVLTLTGTAGTFSATPVGLTMDALGNVDLSTSAPGVYTVRNDVAASGTCPAVFHEVTLTVTAEDDATFAYPSNTLCLGAGTEVPTISGTPGGNFTFSPAGLVINASTGEIDLVTSVANTYAITYTTNGTCPTDTTINVTLTTAPDATFSYDATNYCEMNPTNPVITLTGSVGVFTATPAGLTIDGAGNVDLSTSAPGVYTVRNEIAASGSCPLTFHEETITIDPLDDDGFVYANDTFCLGAGTETPTINLAGGAFTFAPAGLVINAGTGVIDLTTSTAGSYAITYTTAGTCPNDSTLTIVLQDPSDATFAYDVNTFCEASVTDPVITMTGTVGVFTATPAGLSMDANGNIDVSTSAPGVYTVRNEVAASGTCPMVFHEETFTINALDDDGFEYANDTFCLGVGTETPTINLAGGAFTFAPAGLVINAGTGVIDLTTSTAGSYDITYTTAGTCPNDSTLTIVLQDPSDATFAYDVNTACEGSTTDPVITMTGTVGVFTATPAGLSIDANGNIDVSASAVGVYTVRNEIAASGTCPLVFHEETFTVEANPTFTSVNNTVPLCSGTIDLTANVSGVGTLTYYNSQADADAGINAIASPTAVGAGTYFVRLESASGCFSTETITVNNVAGTVALTSNATNDEACLGTDVILTATMTGGTAPFDYSFNSGPFSGVNTSTVNETVVGTYTYDVNVVDGNGCTATNTIDINYIDGGVVDIVASANDVCEGTDITLYTNASAPYLWSTGETTNSITLSGVGVYNITLTAGACDGTANQSFEIFANPTLTIDATNPTPCLGEVVDLSTNPNTFNTYAWSTSESTPVISVSTSGTYDVDVTDGNGCTGTATITLNFADFALSLPASLTPCIGSTVTLDAGAAAGTYAWSTGENTQSIEVTTDGTYIVVAGNGTCTKRDTTEVTFVPGFVVEVSTTDETCIGENDGSIEVDVIGAQAPISYDWNDGNFEPILDPIAPGYYYVLIEDAAGCTDSVNVLVNPADTACLDIEPHYYIPNSFSPNHDGENDILYVRGRGIENFTLIIYDRWGELIFETDELDLGWNGTYKGVALDPAVFAYYFTATLSDGQEIKEYGEISLIK